MINICDVYTTVFKLAGEQAKRFLGKGAVYFSSKVKSGNINRQIQIEW